MRSLSLDQTTCQRLTLQGRFGANDTLLACEPFFQTSHSINPDNISCSCAQRGLQTGDMSERWQGVVHAEGFLLACCERSQACRVLEESLNDVDVANAKACACQNGAIDIQRGLRKRYAYADKGPYVQTSCA